MNLQGKTLFITGASRGIGLAIAKRAARDGANIVIAAKTTEANPKLPGTIHSRRGRSRGRRRPGAGAAVRHPRRGQRGRGGAAGGGALRRHRHPGEQRQRHQPDADAGHADEALRPDVRRQRARHLLLHPGLPGRADQEREGRPQPACAEHEPAAVDARALVQEPRGLHHGQVRHEHVHAGPRRRVSPPRHRGEQPVAAHGHQYRGAADDSGRGHRQVPHAGNPGRRGLPGPDQRREAASPATSSSTTACSPSAAKPTSSATA